MTVATIEREVAKIVADILGYEMELDEKHCLLGDQQYTIPADKQLYLVVFSQAGAPFGGTTFIDNDSASATFGKEVQQATVVHDVRIEQMSFDNSARVRMMEPGLALASFFAQQMAEKYRIGIGRAQTPVDASGTEVTKRLLKYVTHVNVTALHQKIKALPEADYFDKFNIRPGYTNPVNPPKISDQP